MKQIFPGVFSIKKNLFATQNIVLGKKVYGENLIREGALEFREWSPKQSKLAAVLAKGLKELGLKQESTALYLGASTGTTASHVSDICSKGLVFAVDNAPRVVRELVFLSEDRPNMAPLLANAGQPDAYAHRLSKVDWIYQDIASKNQVQIFLKNIELFLEKNGTAILCLKARSVDMTKKSRDVCADAEAQLNKKVQITQKFTLEPYYKDHCLFACKKR